MNDVQRFKALSASKLTRMVGISQKRIKELLGDQEAIFLTREEAVKIIKGNIPLEPFVIGIDEWEKRCEEKDEEKTELQKEFDGLIADSIKEKTKNFDYPLNEEAYRNFLQFRIDFHNKKVSVAGASKQKGKLRKYPEEIQAEMVKVAIEKRWESIFDLSEAQMTAFYKKREEEKSKREDPFERVEVAHISYEDMTSNFE